MAKAIKLQLDITYWVDDDNYAQESYEKDISYFNYISEEIQNWNIEKDGRESIDVDFRHSIGEYEQ